MNRKQTCPDCGDLFSRWDAVRCKACAGLARRRPLGDRFWEKVDKRGPDECWPWLGGVNVNGGGYGFISPGGRQPNTPAHRVSLEIALGRPMAPGMFACHHCDNPPCVNPAHLFEGTAGDNNRDMFAKGRNGTHSLPGDLNPNVKLSDVEVEGILLRYRGGETNQSALARDYGVHHSTINAIVHGKSRANVTRRFGVMENEPDWAIR